MHRTRFLWWLPACLWAATIFYLSTRPASAFPKVEIAGLDKVVHFGLFAMQSLLVLLPLGRVHGVRPWLAASIAFAAASLYGGSDEIHQLFTPSRSSDIMDWVADSAGASLAFIAARFVRPAEHAHD